MIANPTMYDTSFSNLKGKVGNCMAGGIYSSEKCLECGGSFKDTGKALACPDHPDRRAAKMFVRFPGVFIRFNDYHQAQTFLAGLRYKHDEGSFDPRDYRRDLPLGFTNLGEKWLHYRERAGVRSMRHLRNHMNRAFSFFGNTNIKDIGYAGLEDFLHNLPIHLSEKTKANIMATLHAFWVWVIKREKKRNQAFDMPEFPTVEYELKWRKIVDKETQLEILNELYRISWHINPKIYIGCLWLATYLNIRPIELIHIKEADINTATGIMLIKHNKERKPKKVYLLDEDIGLIKSFPPVLHPEKTYFFRHPTARKGVHKDKRGKFGPKYLNTWWTRACENLGVNGVPVYPGTRHSSAIELGDHYSPEEIMGDGTGHATNKAFNRYFKLKAEKKKEIAAQARSAPKLHHDSVQDKKGKILNILDKNGGGGGSRTQS